MVYVVLVAMLAPATMAELVCGETDWQYIMDEPEPVDIACAVGSVIVYNSTANLVAGGEAKDIQVYPASTLNIYGGIIAGGDYGLNFVSGAFVTLYAASAEVDLDTVVNGGGLLITDDYIHNTGASTVWFNLVGTYQDQTPFIIPCALETDAVLGLNIEQSLPEIYVTPARLSWDLGDVPIGETEMQLVVIYNQGAGELNVSSVTLSGSGDFAIASGPETPLVIAPNSAIGADFEITYTPSSGGPASTVITIVSDDGDESVVELTFSGVGVVVDVPPQQQIQDILDTFDASVANGTLLGYGPGNSASKRLNALRNMIESSGDLVNAGDYGQAIDQLESIAKKTDGASKPQDFVVGDSATVLNTMVNDLIADLAS